MTIIPRARALIEHFEGFRLAAYQDSGGVWTIGYGETGPDVYRGVRWTQALADTRLTLRLDRVAGRVAPLVADVPTSPAQFGAFVSAAYNAGVGALATSPMLAAHRAGEPMSAAHAWLDWHVHDRAGHAPAGLLKRRAAETQLYLTGEWQ